MRLRISVAVALLGVLAGVSQADTHKTAIADSPENIRPLLIGADIPDVTLVTPDYQLVVLRERLAKQPTILIYYRGGW